MQENSNRVELWLEKRSRLADEIRRDLITEILLKLSNLPADASVKDARVILHDMRGDM